MQKWIVLICILLVGLISPAPTAHALPEAQRIELEASDGLVLVGDFYMPESEEPVPAVILMHMLGRRRGDWETLLPMLVDDYGMAVLNVDLRGHGETGGSTDWALAEEDVQAWIDWLRGQAGINPDAISLIGASIGSNLAIRGWANDENIRTAVALSPGLNFRGVTTEDAVEANADRPLMLVSARSDRESAIAVTTLFDLTDGNALVRLFSGSRHGTDLFDTEYSDWLITAIAEWVDSQSQ
ncbi:MAG: alpha/beta fold hydrolase [Anaerolineae bacterium]|nr:alpha/beta fold hydrolase [Anaerolineae bacterium]